MKNEKIRKQLHRKTRVRSKIIQKSAYPRLTVFRSNKHIYAQVIDDFKMHTLISESDSSLKDKQLTSTDKAKLVGKALAEKIKKKNIKQVVFDRGHYTYNGRIKALAEAVRESGITI